VCVWAISRGFILIHDETLRLANLGMTPKEIAEEMKLPDSLGRNFSVRGYYG